MAKFNAICTRPRLHGAAIWIVGNAVTLSVASSVMWARSYHATDFVDGWAEDPIGSGRVSSRTVMSRQGSLYVGISTRRTPFSQDEVQRYYGRRPGLAWRQYPPSVKPYTGADDAGPTSLWNQWGFYLNLSGVGSPGWPGWDAIMPWWAIVAITSVIPAGWTARKLACLGRARRRRARGLCLACGYDLRRTVGTPCPECGCLPPPASKSKAGVVEC